MKICPYCKNENPDTNKFCNYCGAQLSGVEPEGGPVEEPDFSRFFAPEEAPAANIAGPGRSAQYEDFAGRPGGQGSAQPGAGNVPQPGGQGAYQPGTRNVPQPGVQRGGRKKNPPQYTYSPTPFDSKIPEIAIGKYVAWAVFDILFSLLFGILGLVFVLKINKSETVEEQQKNLKYARIFLIIGTVIAAMNILLMILPRYF